MKRDWRDIFMIIKTKDEWNDCWNQNSKFFFIIIGIGGRQAGIYTAAQNQATREDSREALWLQNITIIPPEINLTNGNSEHIACSVCIKRHIVKRYKNSDLPDKVLDNRIDNAFIEAGLHDDDENSSGV